MSPETTWAEARPEAHWFDPFFLTMVAPALPALASLASLDASGVAAPRLLHLGCGLGTKTETLRRLGFDPTGIDVDEALLARARASFPRAAFVAADMQELPFADGAFDAAFSFSTLQLVADKARVVDEVARVLRPGGRAIFIENLAGSPLARGYRAMRAALGLRYARFEAPQRHVSLADVQLFTDRFTDVTTRVFHLTTPLTLVVPSLLMTFAKRPMRVQPRAAYAALAGLDARLFRARPGLQRFGWHVVATMTRRAR